MSLCPRHCARELTHSICNTVYAVTPIVHQRKQRFIGDEIPIPKHISLSSSPHFLQLFDCGFVHADFYWAGWIVSSFRTQLRGSLVQCLVQCFYLQRTMSLTLYTVYFKHLEDRDCVPSSEHSSEASMEEVRYRWLLSEGMNFWFGIYLIDNRQITSHASNQFLSPYQGLCSRGGGGGNTFLESYRCSPFPMPSGTHLSSATLPLILWVSATTISNIEENSK